MNAYEMFLILNPDLDEARLDQTLRDIEAVLGKYEAKVVDIDKRGKRRLAYTIKNKRDSHQVILKLEIEPSTVAPIKKQLSITDNILRFTLLALNKQKEKK